MVYFQGITCDYLKNQMLEGDVPQWTVTAKVGLTSSRQSLASILHTNSFNQEKGHTDTKTALVNCIDLCKVAITDEPVEEVNPNTARLLVGIKEEKYDTIE